MVDLGPGNGGVSAWGRMRGALASSPWKKATLWATGSWFSSTRRTPDGMGAVREIGIVLFTEYAFAFEVTSILILVAMLGAVVLARKEEQ